MRKAENQAFTLIELLVVIAIVGLLAAIILVSVNSARMKARDAKRKADLKAIQTALTLYYDEYGHYPRVPFSFYNKIAVSNGDDFDSDIDGNQWIEDMPCGKDNPTGCCDVDGDGTVECPEGKFSDFITIPVDPINTPGYCCGPLDNLAYAYAYGTDAEGQVYDLIAKVENNKDPHRCWEKCWKIHAPPYDENQVRCWCQDVPCFVPAGCTAGPGGGVYGHVRIYADHP